MTKITSKEIKEAVKTLEALGATHIEMTFHKEDFDELLKLEKASWMTQRRNPTPENYDCDSMQFYGGQSLITVHKGKPKETTPEKVREFNAKDQLKTLYIRVHEARAEWNKVFDSLTASATIDERFEWTLAVHDLQTASDTAAQKYDEAFERFMKIKNHPGQTDWKALRAVYMAKEV